MDERVKRARALLAGIEDARRIAVERFGASPERAAEFGVDAETVANDVLEMAIELEQHRATGIDLPRIDRLLCDLSAAIHGGGVIDGGTIRGVDHRGPDADEAPADPQLAIPGSGPPPDAPKGDANGSTKARAVETDKPLDTYELSGADYRALPYDRAWIDGKMPAFRAEHAGKLSKRPRVTIAAWLAKAKAAEPAA